VDFPIKNGGSFHSYVKLPEGNQMVLFTPQEFFVAGPDENQFLCARRILKRASHWGKPHEE
jgi:hypothetical protein